VLFTTHRNIYDLRLHVTGRNARFSDFSPSSADDVVETKMGIGDIFAAQKVTKTGLTSGLFATIFLLFTTHRNIDELCQHVVGRNARFSDIICQVRRATSLKRKGLYVILFNAKKY